MKMCFNTVSKTNKKEKKKNIRYWLYILRKTSSCGGGTGATSYSISMNEAGDDKKRDDANK